MLSFPPSHLCCNYNHVSLVFPPPQHLHFVSVFVYASITHIVYSYTFLHLHIIGVKLTF